jgi:membrane-bound serine protease (ClpP class)
MYSPPTRSAGRRASRATGFLRWCAANMLGAVIVTMLAMPANAAAQRAIILNIDGVIGPAIADYVLRELRTVARGETGLIVLRMNTPGGLDTSMREIVSGILASPVPVATYVAPNGARAASAGTYIAYASAIAGMAPGTNIGAATPVQLETSPLFPGGRPEQPSGQKNGQEKGTVGEPADTESRKAINDAVAYIRSLADLNGRNADWAAEAVRAAASLQASEALKLHVIDVIADDVPDLLRKIDARTATVAGKPERWRPPDSKS